MKSLAIFAVAAFATVLPLAAQNPVYTLPGESGGTFTYLTISQQVEYADSASLAGSDRLLDQAVVTVYSNVARQVTATLSFYQAVEDEVNYEGPLGQPGVTPGSLAGYKPAGTPLWSSGPMVFSVEGDGADNLNLSQLVFSNINTLVPDDIYWSIKFENITNYTDGGPFGPKLEDASTLGPDGAETDPSRFYVRGNDLTEGEWLPVWLTSAAPPTSTLSIQLTAVPEPSTTLLVAGLAVGLMRRRRR